MLFDKNFDLIFSLGEACSSTQILRKCRLQYFSYPFDWLYGSDILTRAKILSNNFCGFIDFQDLEYTGLNNKDENNLCEIYKNTKNNIYFNHDFAYGKPLTETYTNIKNKYDRRAKRLINQIENSKNILIVYLQPPNNETIVNDGTLVEVHTILKNRFKEQSVSFLYLYCQHNKNNIDIISIDDGLYKSFFDYDAYDEKFPYTVNNKILQKLYCKLKITTKYISRKNLCKRVFYLVKCFFRGML